MRRKMINNILFVIGAYLFLMLFVCWREPSLLYYPMRPIEVTPDNLGLKFEDVWLTTADGVRINGWFLPAGREQSLTVLFLHGNAGNISHRMDKLTLLHELGLDVFIIDYRGYGRSDGKPNEQGTYHDAQAAYEYLTKTLKRDPRTIVAHGESLGSAIAVDLAAKVPVAGVVIEEAFTSVADVGQKMFPYLPVRLLVRNKYDTLSKIARINAPLLIFHSREDEMIPWRHGERLFAAAREPKRLAELHGSHNDAFYVSGETYRRVLKEFFESLPHN